MKRLLTICFALVLAPSAFAACSNTNLSNSWTCVQAAGGGNGTSGNLTVNFGSNVTTGSGHGVIVSAETCSDNACGAVPTTLAMSLAVGTNTCSASPGSPFTKHQTRLYIWACPNLTNATTSVAVTCSSQTCWFLTVKAIEVNGMADSSVFDTDGSNAGTSTTPSVSLTTTNTTDLLYGSIFHGDGATTPGSGFTEFSEPVTGSENEGESVIASGAQTVNWTLASSADWEAAAAAIKAAAGGGGATAARRRIVNFDSEDGPQWRFNQ